MPLHDYEKEFKVHSEAWLARIKAQIAEIAKSQKNVLALNQRHQAARREVEYFKELVEASSTLTPVEYQEHISYLQSLKVASKLLGAQQQALVETIKAQQKTLKQLKGLSIEFLQKDLTDKLEALSEYEGLEQERRGHWRHLQSLVNEAATVEGEIDEAIDQVRKLQSYHAAMEKRSAVASRGKRKLSVLEALRAADDRVDSDIAETLAELVETGAVTPIVLHKLRRDSALVLKRIAAEGTYHAPMYQMRVQSQEEALLNLERWLARLKDQGQVVEKQDLTVHSAMQEEMKEALGEFIEEVDKLHAATTPEQETVTVEQACEAIKILLDGKPQTLLIEEGASVLPAVETAAVEVPQQSQGLLAVTREKGKQIAALRRCEPWRAEREGE